MAVASYKQKDLKRTGIGTQKLIIMHGVFHLKSITTRLFTSRKEGGRELHNMKNVMRQEEQSLKCYASRKAERDLLMAE